jgi:cytoskeletal protein RodZ
MAGSVTGPQTGVGSALRRAREVRGLSLDEAARDTRLRTDQLDALERGDFDVLPGEVYVRASLRTYASYLGLDPDKVTDVYARTAEQRRAPFAAKGNEEGCAADSSPKIPNFVRIWDKSGQ